MFTENLWELLIDVNVIHLILDHHDSIHFVQYAILLPLAAKKIMMILSMPCLTVCTVLTRYENLILASPNIDFCYCLDIAGSPATINIFFEKHVAS